MNPNQVEMARHALGLGRLSQRISYRNHYVVGPDCSDHDAWEQLCADGDAVKAPRSAIFGGMDLFWLTRQGAEKVLRKGERLDPEGRFPVPTADCRLPTAEAH